MAIQRRLQLRPQGALEINDTVSRLDDGDAVGYFAAGVPLFVHAKGDDLGKRLAPAQIITLGLANPTEVSEILKIGRTTLYRHQQTLRDEGIEGLLDKKSGPQGGHKLRAEKLTRAQALLDAGQAQREVGRAVGVSENAIRNAVLRGRLKLNAPRCVGRRRTHEGSNPSERNMQDATATLGVATTRVLDRALAAAGKIEEASPEFEASLSVANAGALLALPAMLELGLLDVGEKIYGSLRNGFYGLRSTLLCLTFMALLRIRNPERMQFETPGELGVLLGLDRAPETKTIRRKLTELVERGQARRLSAGLAERWVREAPRA
ncbi:MAG: putative transposase, partial [Patescibacteria group bacterium]